MNPEEFQPFLADLIGRKCRVVRPGDMMTQEISPGRVTVHLASDGTIAKVVIEPEQASGI